ncbi:MAG: hypothetical protein WD768_21425 [Phycisphaeraceae bacterium]
MLTLFSNPTTLAAGPMDWLLGLSRLTTGDPKAELGWRFPLEALEWAAIIIVAALFAGWSYSKLMGPRKARYTLATLRALLIVFIAALLSGPMLVVEDYRLDPDWLLVLVDRSASMTIRDVIEDPGTGASSTRAGGPETRDEALRRALGKHAALFTPERLGKDRRIVWLGFDSSTREIDAPGRPSADAKGLATLPPADGSSTAIRTAIEQALQRTVGRQVAGIVLFSDGRTPQSTGPEVITRLQQHRIGVYPVPLGAEQSPLNIAIARVDMPERAYINDTVPVTVTLDLFPADAPVESDRLTVRLIDKQTGKTLDERSGRDVNINKPIRLLTESKLAGKQTWRVEVVYDAAPDAPVAKRELMTDDNSEEATIELIDRPIRVLYVEGYPRWEYRYLKTMLMREKSIDSSMMLLSADRAFAQEGDSPITRLPVSSEELRPYDVILIGDVPATYFSAEQLAQMRDHVAINGAGIIWIAGEYSMPRSYDNTTLEDLLPMTNPAAVQRVDPALGPILMRPQPLAEALNVLRLRSNPEADLRTRATTAAWPKDLPAFEWAQDIGRLKPTTETLATSQDLGTAPIPLVTRVRYGAGQSIYLASDETWRWRFGRGELYSQQYWIQLIRLIARERLQQRDDRVYMQVSHRRVEPAQTVIVKLVVRDPLILQRNLSKISVAVSKADDPSQRVLERLDLTQTGEADPNRPAGEVREYSAQWQPSAAGDLTLRVIESGLDDLGITESIDVVHPADETRQVATDHGRLKALAEATGGQVVNLNELDSLATLIPSRAQRTENDIREPLWDSPLALILVLLLITAEWIGRKAIRLV